MVNPYYKLLGSFQSFDIYSDISDKNNIQKIDYLQKENSVEGIVSGTQILATNQFKKVISIEFANFRDITNTKVNYLIVNHKSLSKTVKEYTSYRASAQGGKYDTLSVEIDLLYDLFTYGDKNPLAIKRFLNYMMRNSKPQFVFLIGTSSYPQKARKSVTDYQIDLVPNVGFPSADVPFVMGLNGTESNFMSLGIGRLATNNPQTVLDYLKKVKEHESSPMNALWRKKSLKMSGGRTPYEINIFKEYVNDFKQIYEAGFLGGKVDLLAKKTDNPVEFINVTERVNEGVGMITLFGHASSGQADMDIGYCSNELLGYKNKGKYPFVLVNGCDAGDIFGTRLSFGTDWINTPDKGAILFLAHSNLGYPSVLKTYSDEIYHTLFVDSLLADKPFGTVMRESVNRYLKKYPNSIYELANAQQMTLQGDPAVALFPTQNPDYEINNASIFLKNVDVNSPLNSKADSLKVGIVISNLGRISTPKFNLKLNRIYTNGIMDSFEKLNINPINFQDTVYLNIKNDKSLGIGNNRFEVRLDPDNQIIETNKSNNLGILEYNFPSVNISVLSPREFSVVNQKEVNFILQIPHNNNLSVIVELDSSKKFTSNFKKKFTGLATSLLYWKADLLEKDSVVYYVRTKFTNENTWTESSFIYIKNGLEGFAQSSIPQLINTTTDNQILLEESGWKFPSSSLKISAKIYGGNSGFFRPHLANYLIINDKQLIGNGVCYPWNNLNAVAFNHTLKPYSVISSLVCGNSPYSVNYLSTDAKSTDLSDYLNATDTGNYVMLWNSGYLYYDNFAFENLQKLQEIGVDSAKIQRLSKANGSPFLVIGRKGAKKALLGLFPDFDKNPSGEILTLNNYEIKDQFNEGTITSPLIGPASEWGDISLQIQKDKNQTFLYDIVGVNFQGKETILQKNISYNSLKINQIDANKFPFLKLKLTLKTNEEFGKSPQLKSWMVTYKGVPEGIIDVQKSSKISDKQEYENFVTDVWFKNISDKSFKDSITIRQILSNRSLGKTQSKLFKIRALNALDSMKVSVPIQTEGLIGDNTLSLVFNPQMQPEQLYNNNSIDYHFKVIPDKINPILSVTFDGRQIQNNEIVSAKPLIQINLKDENLFSIRTDTTGLEMSLKSCNTCSFKRIYFSNSDISWKANLSINKFIINYLPQNLKEDTLTLQVQGRDLAGNLSGNQPYQISFRIIQKNELKSWLVYPNPFEFFTKFSFTLTGSEIPTHYRIEIYDEQGRFIKTLNLVSQPLHIGINEFIWDGTDSTGKNLPSGTYIYRLNVNDINPNSGKIVILR
ncbi:putative type IX secretion system sortase PorU2 [Arcicella aurantiaca]|uniref:putative type IX secretion system sortase PorU2 n=1 Tax=Arcicella aurantiaca TaxID=591202 RepID=UPI001B870A2D|nr:C25 family cysteine peptidase [Arcicella aurantiaca]